MDNMFSEMLEAQVPGSIDKTRDNSEKIDLRSILSQKSKYNFQVLMHLIQTREVSAMQQVTISNEISLATNLCLEQCARYYGAGKWLGPSEAREAESRARLVKALRHVG